MANTKITSANLDTLTTLVVDDITIDGSTISDSGDLTLDVGGDIILDAAGGDIILKNAGSTNGNIVLGDATNPTVKITSDFDIILDSASDITLDADGADIRLKDAGNTFGVLSSGGSDQFVLQAGTQDKDIIFKGNDGGSVITALTLDMSEAGAATFNGKVGIGTNSIDHQLSVNAADFDGIQLLQGGTDTGYIGVYHDGSSTGRVYVGALSTIDFQTGNGSATDGTSRVRIDGNNLHLNGGTDARIQLGSGGAGANQVSNNTVHIRGDGTDAKYMAASGGVHIFEINGSEIKRITTSGVTYATGAEVRQHYATDNNSYKRYTAPLNPKIVETGLQLYVDPTRATDGTDFSPASYGNGNQDLTLASGTSWGSNADRSYWTFDGTTNAGMYGNPNLSSGKACSFSYWLYVNDVTSLSGGYNLSGIQIGNHYMYIGIVQGNNHSAPLYGYIGQGTNMPAGGGADQYEQAYINSDEWVYLTIQCGHGTSSLTGRTKGRAEVYLNGALVQRLNEIALPTVAANSATDFWLGRVAGGYYLNGLIGPAVVYERMLHQWEILENMRVHADMYVI